jgi:hypothetical protein
LNTTVKQIILLFLISAVVLAPSFSFSDDYMNIDEEAFTQQQRPFVKFYHDEHNEKAGLEDDCALCHHLYEDGKLVEDESSEDMACSECHAQENDPKQIELAATYHNRCRACHVEKKQGPITCGACHKKGK